MVIRQVVMVLQGADRELVRGGADDAAAELEGEGHGEGEDGG